MKRIPKLRWPVSWAHDERGATAVEYGLIVALLALAVSAAMFTVGTDIKAVFTTIGGALGRS